MAGDAIWARRSHEDTTTHTITNTKMNADPPRRADEREGETYMTDTHTHTYLLQCMHTKRYDAKYEPYTAHAPQRPHFSFMDDSFFPF